MSSDFLWSEEKYQQNINPVQQYIKQAGKYLSIQKGISVEEAEVFVKKALRNKEVSKFNDPTVTYFERDESWIRNLKQGPLSGYLKSAINNGEVIVPTLTTYCPATEHSSLVSVFMKRNAGRRGVLKKQAQEEQQKGNLELAYQLNNQQDNAKRNNNSMSGSMAAQGSIFENPTGHNTLTSITRCMSSLSNALNERMIGGNRHYFDALMAINNMTAVVQTMDESLVKAAIDTYGLKIPTAEDVVDVVSRSSDKYWRDTRHLQEIREYAMRMTGYERCAVVYTQDLYHMRKLNPEFMRNFINDFANFDTSVSIEDPATYLNKADPLITNYAHQVFVSLLRGAPKNRSDWDKDTALKVAQSAFTIARSIQKYKLLIDAFLTVETVPCSTAYISHMSRETVVLSDTDSTMFSVDDWVIWYYGDLQFTDHAFAVAGAVMFVATQLIAHTMAILSANMNVARDKLFVLAMKPEFAFPVFAQTPVAKHYFCSVSVKEGAVYKEHDYEIKGVHLKSSSTPASIILPSQERMKGILADIYNGKKIDLYNEILRVADLERSILNSIRKGNSEYLKRIFIKAAASYSLDATKSNYRHHVLWNEVFGPTYGTVEAPPYVVLKFPMITDTKTKMAKWIDTFSDQGLANRYRKYLVDTGRTEVPTMYLSKDYLESEGIPNEIMRAVDTRKIILDLTVTDRMVLETLGYRPKFETLLSEQGY